MPYFSGIQMLGRISAKSIRRSCFGPSTESALSRLELTRFRGHLLSIGEKGVHDGKTADVPARIPQSADDFTRAVCSHTPKPAGLARFVLMGATVALQNSVAASWNGAFLLDQRQR